MLIIMTISSVYTTKSFLFFFRDVILSFMDSSSVSEFFTRSTASNIIRGTCTHTGAALTNECQRSDSDEPLGAATDNGAELRPLHLRLCREAPQQPIHQAASDRRSRSSSSRFVSELTRLPFPGYLFFKFSGWSVARKRRRRLIGRG